MKKIQLFRIKTQSNSMSKVFLDLGSAHKNCAFYKISPSEIEEFTGELFETGDHITVELHRGGADNDDGLHLNGGWIKFSGIAQVKNSSIGLPYGFLLDENGKHIQTMDMIAGINGFPFRNAQLIGG